MTAIDVQVSKATVQQKSVVSHLLELYTHEFSFFRPFDVDDAGRYGYDELDLYWLDPNRLPFLIRVNNKLAGFILLERLVHDPERGPAWDVAEFFVWPRFRRQAVGQQAIMQLWNQYPGRWQVRIVDQNKAASAFWHKAIVTYRGRPLEPSQRVTAEKTWIIYTFPTSPTGAA